MCTETLSLPQCVNSSLSIIVSPCRSSTYQDLGKSAKVSYTSGKWEGKLSRDVISVDGSLAVRAYVVLITKATDFYIKEAEWVGILGMAYSKLAKVCSLPCSLHASLSVTYVSWKAGNTMRSVQLWDVNIQHLILINNSSLIEHLATKWP